jgi:hypothetical protein
MEKSLSFPTKLLLLGAGGLAFVAGPILFLFPTQTANYFAWTIKHPLTPIFMGANYVGGIGAIWAMYTNRWSVTRVLLPGVFTFAVTQLLATLLHIPIFNWHHPIAWAWLFVYIVSPPATAFVYSSMERGYQASEPSRPFLSSAFKGVMLTFALITGLIGLALIFWPFLFTTQGSGSAVPWWAWSLTPLTARVVGGWYLAGCVLYATLSREKSLDRVRIGLFSLMLVNGLQLLGALLYRSAFNGPTFSIILYLLISITSFGYSAIIWLRGQRTAPMFAS